MEDRVFGVVFFHRIQVVGTLKEVLPLARSVLCANGLAVDTLSREALFVNQISTL